MEQPKRGVKPKMRDEPPRITVDPKSPIRSFSKNRSGPLPAPSTPTNSRLTSLSETSELADDVTFNASDVVRGGSNGHADADNRWNESTCG